MIQSIWFRVSVVRASEIKMSDRALLGGNETRQRESLSEASSSSIPLRFCQPLHVGFHMKTCPQSSSLNFSHHSNHDYRLWRDSWVAPGIMHKMCSHIPGA